MRIYSILRSTYSLQKPSGLDVQQKLEKHTNPLGLNILEFVNNSIVYIFNQSQIQPLSSNFINSISTNHLPQNDSITLLLDRNNKQVTPRSLKINAQYSKLCDGFKEKQRGRLLSLRERCEMRRNRFAKANQSDPIFGRFDFKQIYLNRNKSLMWCQTRKVMSTSWSRALFALEGLDTSNETNDDVDRIMTNTFNYRESQTVAALLQLPAFDAYQKLLFVRDPFERFLSVYLDKIQFHVQVNLRHIRQLKLDMYCKYRHRRNVLSEHSNHYRLLKQQHT